MRRIAVLLLCISVAAVAHAQGRRRAVPPGNGNGAAGDAPALGSALAGLNGAQLNAFNAGRAMFTRDETPGTGLGPVFNQRSCSECHNASAVGGGGNRTVTRI